MATRRASEVDERWIAEWFAWGYAALIRYLTCHAEFAHYLEEHHRDDPENPPDSDAASPVRDA